MNHRRLSSIAGVVAGLFLLALTADRSPAQGPAAEFKIGWTLPLVGPIAEVAKAYMEGGEVALAMVNDAGGIGGLKTRMVICDSQGQEPQAVICTKKLINDDQVNLMLGATGTPATMAILPTIEAAGIPLFGLGAGSTIWEPVKKWVFKSFPANDDQIPAELEFAKKKGWNRVALITDNSAFGKDTANVVRAVAKQKGLDLVADESYAPSDTDVTAQVTRIRAINPDLILNLAGGTRTAVLVAKKVQQLGLKTPLMHGTNLVIDTYPQLVPQVVEQSYFAGSKAVVSDLSPTDPLYPTISAFVKKFKEMRGASAKITANSLPVADVILLTHAVTKGMGAKVLDKAALRDAIEGAKGVPGLQGIWTHSRTNHGTSFVDGVLTLRYVSGDWRAAQ